MHKRLRNGGQLAIALIFIVMLAVFGLVGIVTYQLYQSPKSGHTSPGVLQF